MTDHPTSVEASSTPDSAPMQYDRMLVVLHWVLAIGLIAQLGLGVWMEDLPKDPPGYRAQWFNIHKSIGLCLGFLILWRLGWRVTHSVPAPVNTLNSWQQKLAAWAHRLMYLSMLLMPVTGFMGSSFSPYPVKFFGWALPKWFAPNPDLKSIFAEAHETTADIFMCLLALHFAAVLWHVFVKRDGLIKRMTWGRANSD